MGFFYLEGFVRGSFSPSPLLSEYMYTRYNRKLNITFNFRFHMYEKNLKSVTSQALGPLPLSQNVTPFRAPSPSSTTYFMEGPLVSAGPVKLGSCTSFCLCAFQLSKELGFALYLRSNLTFTKCLEMNLQDHIETIAKVAEIAGKEYSIEQVRCSFTYQYYHGTWWRIGNVDTCRPEGRGFESRSSRHVGTLGKSLTRSCLWCFGVKHRHSIRAVSGALLSSSGLETELFVKKVMMLFNSFKLCLTLANKFLS